MGVEAIELRVGDQVRAREKPGQRRRLPWIVVIGQSW